MKLEIPYKNIIYIALQIKYQKESIIETIGIPDCPAFEKCIQGVCE